MQVRHSGLIIRESDVGESDRIITVLTADNGIIRAFSRGSKKIKSKLFSSTRMFTFGDFDLHQGKDKYIVTEAKRRMGFFGTPADIERLALAQYICELCSVAVAQEQPDESGEVLRLVLNTLYAIDKTDKPLDIIKPSFELRMMAALGYCPDVSECAQCGERDGDMFFYKDDGQMLCRECGSFNAGGETVSPSVVSAMRYILSCDVEKLFSYSIPEEARKQLGKVSEKYTLSCLERTFKTLDFYNSL